MKWEILRDFAGRGVAVGVFGRDRDRAEAVALVERFDAVDILSHQLLAERTVVVEQASWAHAQTLGDERSVLKYLLPVMVTVSTTCCLPRSTV